MISDDDRERVRQATDIIALVGETVQLKQRGSNDFWGCCPFHHEKSPSFHVNASTGLWKCFGCGAGGDVYDYVMKRENLDFPDAIRYLADRAGIELTEERGSAHKGPRRNRIIECLTQAEAFYSLMLMRGRGEGPDAGRKYLAGRGFGSAICKRWHLGYAPGRGTLVAHLRQLGFSNAEMLAADLAVERSGRLQDRFYDRVMFPIHDEQGRTIAFGGRVLTDAKPKYLNTKETAVFHKGKHLFAFDRAKESIAAKGVAIVSEGYTDVISLHEAGYTNAVAALGTSFSLDHVRTLSRFARKIICMFDGDAAGQKAAERAIQFIDKTEADLRCVVLPNNQDPAEFLASHDHAELQLILDAAEPLMDFVFRKRLAGFDLSSPGRRVAALNDLAELLAPLKNSYLLDAYATQLADALGMDVEETKRVIRSKPVKSAEPEGSIVQASRVGGGYSRQGAGSGYQSRGGSGSRRQPSWQGGSAGRSGSSWQRGSGGVSARPQQMGVPTYLEAYPEAEESYYEDAPADYVPDFEGGAPVEQQVPASGSAATGQPRGFVSLEALSGEERQQVAAERELLSMLATDPDSLRPYADRIAQISWTDSRHEAMAWAILATPEGTSPAEAVRAATEVEPLAPKVLASGRLVSTPGMTQQQKVDFVLQTVELFSTKRRIREIRSRLRGGSSVPGDEAERLFEEATQLQRHANELSKQLSGVDEG